MLLRQEIVDEPIDRELHVRLLKEVRMTPAPLTLGLVRKRMEGATGPAVLLVHGFAQNRYTWHGRHRSFVNHLASCGFDVFNLELRGHGRSRLFGAPLPTSIDELVLEDLPAAARELEEACGRGKFFIIGHSMGGLVAMQAAATVLASCVRGVVAIAPPHELGRGSPALDAFARIVLAFGEQFEPDDRRVPSRFVGRSLARAKKFWELMPLPLRAWRPGKVENIVLAEYLDRAFDRTTVGLLTALLSGRHRPVVTDLAALRAPLLVVSGTHDSLAPPASARPAFEGASSDDKTYREFALGHIDLIVGAEAPVTVWPLVSGWLSRR